MTLSKARHKAPARRLALPLLLGGVAVLLMSACVDVAPPTPKVTPIPTETPISVPTATPVPQTPTPTSTATLTPTASPTATATPAPIATQPGIVYDPRTGLPTVPQFTPPTGQLTPSAGILPGTGSAPSTLPIGGGTGTGAPGGGQSTAWGCDGDEVIQFVPALPVVGQKVFIYVTAARDRQFVLLYGPQTTGVADKVIAGGTGLRRGWEVVPASQGIYTYEFYAGPSPQDLCVTASFEAVTTLARKSTPAAPAPPTPVGTPRPDH